MSKKGLLTLVLGGTALLTAGYAATGSAVTLTAIAPVGIPAPIGVSDVGSKVDAPRELPSRPPARSLYRPGPRNPPTVLE